MKKFTLSLFVILICFQHNNIQAQTQILSQNPIRATTGIDANHKLTYTSGTYSVWQSDLHTGIQRPIIIVEGWDPLNSFNEDRIYRSFRTDESLQLADQLHDAGYDIVILNFNDGADYIQKNAFLLVKLIQDINTLKTQNGSTEKNVVVGVSMGGLVARYALRYMEQHGLNHDTPRSA